MISGLVSRFPRSNEMRVPTARGRQRRRKARLSGRAGDEEGQNARQDPPEATTLRSLLTRRRKGGEGDDVDCDQDQRDKQTHIGHRKCSNASLAIAAVEGSNRSKSRQTNQWRRYNRPGDLDSPQCRRHRIRGDDENSAKVQN